MANPKRPAAAQSLKPGRSKQQKPLNSEKVGNPHGKPATSRSETDGIDIDQKERDRNALEPGGDRKDDAENEDSDEEDDDDYDPLKKHENVDEESDVSDSDEKQPDYSAISTDISQVRTRNQKYRESTGRGSGPVCRNVLFEDTLRVNVDAIFQSLQKTSNTDDWALLVQGDDVKNDSSARKEKASDALGSESINNTEGSEGKPTLEEEQVRIYTTYTFAGKLVREEKFVDANSAEAKAYLNSTNGVTAAPAGENLGPHRSYVTVVRKIVGADEEKPLRIKLKRPSLIDKFLLGDKKNTLTTLEKSRLDWASFVDKKKLKDDLAIHNKGGYLEKQAFLGRMEAKRDTQYQRAKDLERQRQWQQQQQQQQQQTKS